MSIRTTSISTTGNPQSKLAAADIDRASKCEAGGRTDEAPQGKEFTYTGDRPAVIHDRRGVIRRQCSCEDSSERCEMCADQSRPPRHADLVRIPSSAKATETQASPTNLTVGAVNDPLEGEADRIAQAVISRSDADVHATAAPFTVSRSCAGCAAENLDSDQHMRLQRAHESPSPTTEAPTEVHAVLGRPGAPLSNQLRSFFEPRFGHDLESVRIHDDAAAARSAAIVGAAAYTVGSHIVFATGRYVPGSTAGKRLLAHELAHVMQQGRGAGLLRRRTDFDAALASKNWQAAAEILNGYNREGIDNAIGKLSQGIVAAVHQGALDNPRLGSDSAIAMVTRSVYLDINFENEVRSARWDRAALYLNGFNRGDIAARLKGRSIEIVQALHDGAVANQEVGPQSSVAVAAQEELNRRENQPATGAAAKCASAFQKAAGFRDLINLVSAAETKLTAVGITDATEQIHALRGIYYGTTWSLDFTGAPGERGEESTTRNEGFQRFTRPSQPPSATVPRDVRAILDCGLFSALKQSQDIIDPSGRKIDFGHLIIGLDARFDPARASTIEYPVPTRVGTINHELGGTGTELVTWVGDLGGAAAHLALLRISAPSTSVRVVFQGSDYGGSINLEGDISGSVVASGSNTQVTAPNLSGGKRLSDLLQDYLAPAKATPSAAWNQRAATFLAMNGGKFDSAGALANRDIVVAAMSDKFQTFCCDYLSSRVKDKHNSLDQAKAAASIHVVSASHEVATAFVDALIDSMKSGGPIEATRFPTPSSGRGSACAVQFMAAEVLSP